MDHKEIYFAGGCFWGVEHFFKGVTGVTATMPGYANGQFADPTYEQVYKDDTGFAETVRVTYNPSVVGLDLLCRLFFMIIDPLSLNKQGEDVGTRYRTGIYYSSEADLPVLERAFAAERARLVRAGRIKHSSALVSAESLSQGNGNGIVTELLPLECFYGAEEYHQKYLDKNPGGYCHLSIKTFAYLKVFEKVRMYLGNGSSNSGVSQNDAATAGETDWIARMSEIAAIIHEGMRFFWTGFYRVVPKECRPVGLPHGHLESHRIAADLPENCQLVLGPFQGYAPENCQLVLGPFQGPPACLRIAYGRGVCGTAWKEGRTIVVPDVEQFPGHIACSSASRSEIVVPVFAPVSVTDAAGAAISPVGVASRTVIAVLDIDSDRTATFDAEDARWLELIVEWL